MIDGNKINDGTSIDIGTIGNIDTQSEPKNTL